MMRQITFKMDEGDYKSLSSLLKKVNAERARPINMSCLLRIVVSENLNEERRDYRYVREALRKEAIRAPSGPRERYDKFAKPEMEQIEIKTRSIESLHQEFDKCCENAGITPAGFANWMKENASQFRRSITTDWYYEASVPDETEKQEEFTGAIKDFIVAMRKNQKNG